MRILLDDSLQPLVNEWQQIASERLGASIATPAGVVGLALRVTGQQFREWLDTLPNPSPVSTSAIAIAQPEPQPESTLQPSIDPVLDRLSTVLTNDF